jgi:hypothetical protein
LKKIRIKLVTLGNLKHRLDFRLIERWRSKVFKAEHVDQVQALPNTTGDSWSYPDTQLARIVAPDSQHDFTLAVINAPLQDNYYLRRLGNRTCVLSLYETAEILRQANLTVESFVIRNLYGLCCVYELQRKEIPPTVYAIAHDETRGCLFDMNGNKADIVFSTERPTVCPQCKAAIMRATVPKEFLPQVEKELRRIRKAVYYRLSDWVRRHPLWALGITSLVAVILNLVAAFLYPLIRDLYSLILEYLRNNL